MKDFTVDRRKWYRGRGSQYSALVVNHAPDEGMMCCVGFQCVAEGIEKDFIDGVGAIEDIPRAANVPEDILEVAVKRGRSLGYASDAYAEIYTTNDDEDIDDTERERVLTELFAELGVKISFVN